MGGVKKWFGFSPKGADMSAEDSATEDKIQEALDKAYGTPGTFGQHKVSAADAEDALRKQGVLPQGWRLRESDSTSSGYRPTQAASKKMAALHAGQVASAAFGGMALAGIGPLAAAASGAGAAGGAAGSGLTGAALTNAGIQGGLGAAQGAATGGLKGALLGGALGAGGSFVPGVSSAITKNPLTQKALSFGINTGINSAVNRNFSPLGTAIGAGQTFMPNIAGAATTNPMAQRAINFGGNLALNRAGGGSFDPVNTGLGGLGVVNPKLAGQLRGVQGIQGVIPGRQQGGPVEPGKPYVVGEKGPEVVVPSTPGYVNRNPNTGPPPTWNAPVAAPAADDGTDGGNWWDRYGGAVTTIGGGVGGMIAARKAQQAAAERSPEEQAAINAVMGPNGAAGVANSLMGESRPYISKPASYYQTLLNGDRAAMANATAAPRTQLNEGFRGAQQNLARSGIRGAARDVLSGNLEQQRAGQVAGLTTGVQPGAATALAGLGQGLQQSAVPLYGSANNFYGQLLNNGVANRTFAANEGDKTGKAIGGMVEQLSNLKFGKGKAPVAGQPLPTVTPKGPGQGNVLTGPGGFTVPPQGQLGPPPVDVDYGGDYAVTPEADSTPGNYYDPY